jgi:hypothetical protein
MDESIKAGHLLVSNAKIIPYNVSQVEVYFLFLNRGQQFIGNKFDIV